MNKEMDFGQYLKHLIASKGITQAEFRRILGISKTYLIDIQKGNAFPAPELQTKMVEALSLDDTCKICFYDKAAYGRNELPTDIFKYLFQNTKAIAELREKMRD